jgi:hypothetical protein
LQRQPGATLDGCGVALALVDNVALASLVDAIVEDLAGLVIQDAGEHALAGFFQCQRGKANELG